MAHRDNGYEIHDLVCKGVLNQQSAVPHAQLQILIVKLYQNSIKSSIPATNLTRLTEESHLNSGYF